MQNSEPLVFLGIAIIVTAVVVILLPYLRRRSDLLTSWNILWFGGALFTGIGSLAVVYGNFHWVELQWFQPTRSNIQKYIIGSIAFYGSLLFLYYVASWPKSLSARVFNNWPPLTFPLLVVALSLFAAIAIVAHLTQGVVFFGPLFLNITHKGLVFSVVLAFCYWYRDRKQHLFLALFLIVYLFAALDSMVLFRGRRLLLSVAVAPLICLYWQRWRYLPPRKNLILVGLAALMALSLMAFYSTFRRFDLRADATEGRNFSSILRAIKDAKLDDAVGFVTNDAFFYFSNYCAHYSLLTIHLVENKTIPVEPVHSLKFIAVYPIPRALYPNKPQLLSSRIVTDVLRLPYNTNWGLGIVGTGYHEGGIPVIILYAAILVVYCRFIDDPLARQPNNPFILAMFVTSLPHFAGMIRGDFAIMITEVSETLIFGWALGFAGRIFFGRLK